MKRGYNEDWENVLHGGFAIDIYKQQGYDPTQYPLIQIILNFVESVRRGHVALAKKDDSQQAFNDIQAYGLFKEINISIDDLEARAKIKNLQLGLSKLMKGEQPTEQELEEIHTTAEGMARYLVDVIEKYISPLEKRLQQA